MTADSTNVTQHSAAASDDGDAPPAIDFRRHRGMLILVAALGLVFLALFGLVISTVAVRLSFGGGTTEAAPASKAGSIVRPGGTPKGDSDQPAASPLPSDQTLVATARPAGAVLIAVYPEGDRLWLHYRLANGGDLLQPAARPAGWQGLLIEP